MYAVAKPSKSGEPIFFGPNQKGAPWHRNASSIKHYRHEAQAESVAKRAGGYIVDFDSAVESCGGVVRHSDMIC